MSYLEEPDFGIADIGRVLSAICTINLARSKLIIYWRIWRYIVIWLQRMTLVAMKQTE